MGERADVWQGTLALMVLKTLQGLGPLHGYGIARRIEQTSGDLLAVNYGTLYPALLKLEQEGYISSEWGVSDNNRKARSDYEAARRTNVSRSCFHRHGFVSWGDKGYWWRGLLGTPISVTYFFVSSGFLLAYNYSERSDLGQMDTTRFLLGRVARLSRRRGNARWSTA
jgi:Transcriptional regulator PadR-like family